MNENTVPDEGEELIMTDEEIAISDSALDTMWKKLTLNAPPRKNLKPTKKVALKIN